MKREKTYKQNNNVFHDSDQTGETLSFEKCNEKRTRKNYRNEETYRQNHRNEKTYKQNHRNEKTYEQNQNVPHDSDPTGVGSTAWENPNILKQLEVWSLRQPWRFDQYHH